MPPCDDPVLQALGKADADAQWGVWVIERLVRLLRSHEPDSVALNGLTETDAFAGLATEELQAAGEWLVGQGCAEWLCADPRAIRLLRRS